MCTYCDARAIVYDAVVTMYESPDLGERLEARGVSPDRVDDVVKEIERILADLAHWADGTYSLVPTWDAMAGGLGDAYWGASVSICRCHGAEVVPGGGPALFVWMPNFVCDRRE